MSHRAFFAMIMPSLALMIVFVALPLVSIAWQSVFIEHRKVLVPVEACNPFGCQTELRVDASAVARLNRAAPSGKFNGLATYADSSHLAIDEIRRIWRESPGLATALREIAKLRFYNALLFTLAFTLVVTPGTILLGFAIALAVDAVPKSVQGAITYVTLLPMIVPSIIGAMVILWMLDTRGLIGATLQFLFRNPSLSVLGSAPLMWVAIFCYAIWSSAPYAFLVFYAGIQTVPRETLESAMVDGASSFARLRHVIWPHLQPIAIFLVVVSLMDNFRVFETIIGFNAAASASSISILIYQDLQNGDSPSFGSAAATSILTVLAIAVMLTPSMIRSWNVFRRKQ